MSQLASSLESSDAGHSVKPEFVYRFRSIDKLLGKKELERSEFRLASPSELNDPMEGYKDVVFRGDDVLWENLLRHYILALVSSIVNSSAIGDASSDAPDIRATLTADDLPTDAFRGLYREACDDFFSQPGVSSLSASLTTLRKPLRREGVIFLLGLVHSVALASAIRVMKTAGALPANAAELPVDTGKLDEILKAFEAASAEEAGEDFETVAFAANRLRDEQSLRALIRFESLNADGARRLRYLLYTFPERYVESVIDGLVYPRWHTVCFSGNCTDASMWGVYGDEHRGVALVFRPQSDEGRLLIPLVGANGTSSVVGQPTQYTRGPIKGLLEEVKYSDRPPEVDFFQSLGTLSRARLERAWHVTPSGARSKLVDGMITQHAEWRAAYWEGFRRAATTKLLDWKHEQEYRFFLADILHLGDEPRNRLVQYDFSSLVGIVFGLRASETDKLEVMKTVIALCKSAGRSDFAFHQMAYSATLGRLLCV